MYLAVIFLSGTGQRQMPPARRGLQNGSFLSTRIAKAGRNTVFGCEKQLHELCISSVAALPFPRAGLFNALEILSKLCVGGRTTGSVNRWPAV